MKKYYYASVSVTLTADRTFTSVEERDKYLASVSKDTLAATNPLYDNVNVKIDKCDNTGRRYVYNPCSLRFNNGCQEENEDE